MSEINYGYISATFSDDDVRFFKRTTLSLCKPTDFYKSENEDYINGDVSGSLHMTLFYGLLDNVCVAKVNEVIASLSFEVLALGDIDLRVNKDLPYKILWVPVLDVSGELRVAADLFKQFPYEKDVQLEFMPHLSLAYVKPEYKLSVNPVIPRTLKVKKFSYFNR